MSSIKTCAVLLGMLVLAIAYCLTVPNYAISLSDPHFPGIFPDNVATLTITNMHPYPAMVDRYCFGTVGLTLRDASGKLLKSRREECASAGIEPPPKGPDENAIALISGLDLQPFGTVHVPLQLPENFLPAVPGNYRLGVRWMGIDSNSVILQVPAHIK